jgi:hypothetical protein
LRLDSFSAAPDAGFRPHGASAAREEHDIENDGKEELADRGDD